MTESATPRRDTLDAAVKIEGGDKGLTVQLYHYFYMRARKIIGQLERELAAARQDIESYRLDFRLEQKKRKQTEQLRVEEYNKRMGLINENGQLQQRLAEAEDKLERIKQWCRAYPLAVFPEPDLKRAAELLQAGGITLDSVSASSMRHVTEGIAAIAQGKK